MVIFLIFVFIAYFLEDLTKIKKMPKNIQNHPSVLIGGPDTIHLLIFRPHILGDLPKKNMHTKLSLRGDWVSVHVFFAYFMTSYIM